jgi:hypothetical protein
MDMIEAFDVCTVRVVRRALHMHANAEVKRGLHVGTERTEVSGRTWHTIFLDTKAKTERINEFVEMSSLIGPNFDNFAD